MPARLAIGRKSAHAAHGEPRSFFEKNFTPYRFRAAKALFTGYYEPEIHGSRPATAHFRHLSMACRPI